MKTEKDFYSLNELKRDINDRDFHNISINENSIVGAPDETEKVCLLATHQFLSASLLRKLFHEGSEQTLRLLCEWYFRLLLPLQQNNRLTVNELIFIALRKNGKLSSLIATQWFSYSVERNNGYYPITYYYDHMDDIIISLIKTNKPQRMRILFDYTNLSEKCKRYMFDHSKACIKTLMLYFKKFELSDEWLAEILKREDSMLWDIYCLKRSLSFWKRCSIWLRMHL